MKFLFLVAVLLFWNLEAFSEDLVETCQFVMKIPGEKEEIPTTFRIFVSEGKFYSRTTQVVEGQSIELPVEAVTVDDFPVRANLKSVTSELNRAEDLILGTMNFLKTPELREHFKFLDLEKIRRVKTYQMGEFTHMGGSIIMDAKDEAGNRIGSFLTGFIPFECQPENVPLLLSVEVVPEVEMGAGGAPNYEMTESNLKNWLAGPIFRKSKPDPSLVFDQLYKPYGSLNGAWSRRENWRALFHVTLSEKTYYFDCQISRASYHQWDMDYCEVKDETHVLSDEERSKMGWTTSKVVHILTPIITVR